MSLNVRKCLDMSRNVSKCREMSRNVSKCLEIKVQMKYGNEMWPQKKRYSKDHNVKSRSKNKSLFVVMSVRKNQSKFQNMYCFLIDRLIGLIFKRWHVEKKENFKLVSSLVLTLKLFLNLTFWVFFYSIDLTG